MSVYLLGFISRGRMSKASYNRRRKRQRSRGNGNRIKFSEVFKNTQGTVKLTTPTADYSAVTVSFSDSAVDIPSTDYSKRIYSIVKPEGFKPFIWLYPKAYSRTICNTRVSSHEWTTFVPDASISGDPDGPTWDSGFRTPWGGTSIPSDILFGHYVDFNSKLRNDKVDLLTFAAEGKSSFAMLANAFTDLCKLYRAVRKADAKAVRRVLKPRRLGKSLSSHWRKKTAQNRWLELQYGWLPLYGDLKTAFEAMSDLPEADLLKISHSTRFEKEYPYKAVSAKSVLTTRCYYVKESSALRQAAQWNLGINPLLTAWELVPYSFVVDWFIPIGDFIGQFGSSVGLKFISGTTAYFEKCELERKRSSSTFVGPYYCTCDIIYSQSTVHTERRVLTTSPIGFPEITLGLSGKRALNALALITQRK